jgi:hypothetical protein
MPKGARSQVWYPSVVELLRRSWHEGLNWDATIELRDTLQRVLDRHQDEHGIRRATFRCPRCGEVSTAARPRISVRAMLITLRRFGITSTELSIAREREWKRYRALHDLDLYGHPAASSSTDPASPTPCAQHHT